MGLGKERQSDWEENPIVQEEPCSWEGAEFTYWMAIGPTLDCASNVKRWKRKKREQEIKRGKGKEGLVSSSEGTKGNGQNY